jgi:hypothetical protein
MAEEAMAAAVAFEVAVVEVREAVAQWVAEAAVRGVAWEEVAAMGVDSVRSGLGVATSRSLRPRCRVHLLRSPSPDTHHCHPHCWNRKQALERGSMEGTKAVATVVERRTEVDSTAVEAVEERIVGRWEPAGRPETVTATTVEEDR